MDFQITKPRVVSEEEEEETMRPVCGPLAWGITFPLNHSSSTKLGSELPNSQRVVVVLGLSKRLWWNYLQDQEEEDDLEGR